MVDCNWQLTEISILIIQWGYHESSAYTNTIYFPIAFNNALVCVFDYKLTSAVTNDDGTISYDFLSNDRMIINVKRNRYFNWLAIGN